MSCKHSLQMLFMITYSDLNPKRTGGGVLHLPGGLLPITFDAVRLDTRNLCTLQILGARAGLEDRGGGDNSIQFINIGRVGDKSFKELRLKIGGWKGG